MRIPWLSLILIPILLLFGGCNREDRIESKKIDAEVIDPLLVITDRDLISLILDGREERRRSAISEFRRRIDKGLFNFDEAMPTSQRDRLIPILIEEIEEHEEIDPIDIYSSNDPWWVLISLQGACLKPNKEAWRDWWANSNSTVFWTYPQKKNQ